MQIPGLAMLAREVQQQATFNAGAQCFLEGIKGDISELFSQQRPKARLLRAFVHLVSDAGYRGLAMCDWAPESDQRTDDPARVKPSATLWRYVKQHNAIVAVTALTKAIRVYAHGGNVNSYEPSYPDVVPTDPELSFRYRDTTHLLGLPIYSRGVPLGMLSLEVFARDLVTETLWDTLVEPLSEWLDLIAPMLLQLPTDSIKADATTVSNLLTPKEMLQNSNRGTLVDAFAAVRENVLITGPTGAGKTYLAEYVHTKSPNSKGAFVTYTYHSYAAEMQAAHLTGWKKHSFSDAKEDYAGLIKQAEGGTMFIDEVDKLTLDAQKIFLQLVDKGVIQALGGNQGRIGNVRFIFATNANLGKLVEDGTFLRDLYFRISTLPISVPPLDDRRHEIPNWARHFASELEVPGAKNKCSLTAAALRLLEQSTWPGNLRELRTNIVRAFVLASPQAMGTGDIVIDDRHLQEAKKLSGGPNSGADHPLDLLEQLARALYHTAQAEDRDGKTDTVINFTRENNVLFAAAWVAAAEDLDDKPNKERARVARLIGKEASIKLRNYTNARKAAFETLSKFYNQFGGTAPAIVQQLIDSD